MLILEDIIYHYEGQVIVDNISLNLVPGQIMCVTGPSGCGKTTLLRIAAGSIAPVRGKVKNLFARTACVFQEPRLLPWRTTLENIAFGLLAQEIPVKQRQQIARQLARQLGIEKAAKQYPHQLSGGMQQRVALGRALAVAPDLLLLDEPFSALDIGRRHQLQDLLLRLLGERQLATLLISHDLVEAVRLGRGASASGLAYSLVILSPSPARVVYRWEPDRFLSEEDDSYIYKTVSNLFAIPEIATCFGLRKSVKIY